MASSVLLIRNVMPEYYGGGETYQLMLAEELRRNGFEPVVVTSSKKLIEEARKRKIMVREAPFMKWQNWSGWRNALLLVYWIWQLRLRKWYRGILREYHPMAVNIQSRDDWLAATVEAKRARIRILWTDHMDFRSWVFQNVNVRGKNWIGKRILKRARDVKTIIFISDYERKSFESTVKPRQYNNLKTIKNGVIDRYAKYINMKAQKGSFCYVGRVVKYKGIGELIEAFEAVGKKYPEARLNIYGGGEDIIKYQKMADGNKQIKFYGQVDDPLAAMADNEMFVLPSYREGLSLSLLDAAMMKRKIIVSDVDGNPEVVKNGQTGLLVPVGNKDKLTEAMIYMLENEKEAEKMARNVRNFYEENYDFEKIFAEKMLPLYNIEKEQK